MTEPVPGDDALDRGRLAWLLAGARALVGGTLLGWNGTLLTAIATPPPIVRAFLVACPPWRRCGASSRPCAGSRRAASIASGDALTSRDLASMVRGVRYVFLAVAALSAGGGLADRPPAAVRRRPRHRRRRHPRDDVPARGGRAAPGALRPLSPHAAGSHPVPDDCRVITRKRPSATLLSLMTVASSARRPSDRRPRGGRSGGRLERRDPLLMTVASSGGGLQVGIATGIGPGPRSRRRRQTPEEHVEDAPRVRELRSRSVAATDDRRRPALAPSGRAARGRRPGGPTARRDPGRSSASRAR